MHRCTMVFMLACDTLIFCMPVEHALMHHYLKEEQLFRFPYISIVKCNDMSGIFNCKLRNVQLHQLIVNEKNSILFLLELIRELRSI
uniref:Secreted protein n=1 Tax=Oryza brachyantha TaxID=4533 RepID=J3L2C1_ORYBR